jgi:HTH-like domain
VLTDLVVLFADGRRCISNLAMLRDQPVLFGRAASTATAWRVLPTFDRATWAHLRALRDERLKPEIIRVHAENDEVYGADKVWVALNREGGVDGPRVARCTAHRDARRDRSEHC